jgi:hypothetical protein
MADYIIIGKDPNCMRFAHIVQVILPGIDSLVEEYDRQHPT